MENRIYEWEYKYFNQLSTNDLYEILKLRMEIFIIEQQSIYLDIDDLDYDAVHFLGKDKDFIIAYGRVYLSKDRTAYIQRVCIKESYRQNKLGAILMNNMLDFISKKPDIVNITLNAQCQLQKFYEKYDFQTSGKPFEDGGIMHIKMIKNL